jgi:hypothetical protein
MKIISIDPGANTAICACEWSGEFGEDLKMDYYVGFDLSGSVKSKFDKVCSYLRDKRFTNDFGMIERPFAHRDSKGQVNINSYATQITNYTIITLAFEVVFGKDNRSNLIEIWPKTWQVILNAAKGQTGERSIQICENHTGLTMVSDHVADAYSMALWGMGIAKIKQNHQFNRDLDNPPATRTAAQAYHAIHLAAAGSKIGDLYE